MSDLHENLKPATFSITTKNVCEFEENRKKVLSVELVGSVHLSTLSPHFVTPLSNQMHFTVDQPLVTLSSFSSADKNA